MLLAVWAIVAFVATAKAHNGVQEYSNEAVEALKIEPISEPVEAHLINSHVEMEFLEQGNGFDNLEENEVFVEAYRFLTPKRKGNKHKICRSYLGIKIPDTNEVFCRIRSFRLTQTPPVEPDGQRQLYISLQFGLLSETELAVYIPVFKAPAEVVPLLESLKGLKPGKKPPNSDHQTDVEYQKRQAQEKEEDEKRTKWGADNKVGTYSFVDLTLFELLTNGKPIFVNFGWLKELLQYGLTKLSDLPPSSEESEPITRYLSRPIVLTDPLIEKFITFVEMYNTPKEVDNQEEEEEEEEEDVYDD